MYFTITEYIVGIGLDTLKGTIKDNYDFNYIKKQLEEFVEIKFKFNYQCSHQDELDFGNLADYICSNLIKDVQQRMMGNKLERANARKTILNKAIEYANANNIHSSQRAIKFVEEAIDIIREFYLKKIPQDLKLVTAEIEDTICKGIYTQTDQLNNAITESKKELKDIISRSVESCSVLPIDRSIALLNDGNIDQLEKEMSTYLKAIGTTHKLYPYYSFALGKDNKLYSQPLNEEALIKYPPKISCTGNIKIGDQYIDNFENDIYDYAYRHQIPITFEILTATKYLGENTDPVQHEAEKIIGQTKTIMPKQFPPAMPCSIALDNEVYFDYILLRTEEILDDGTVIISNKEQKNCNFLIELKLNTKTHKSIFSIKTLTLDNEDILKSSIFIKRMSDGVELMIKVLSLGNMLVKAKFTNYNYNGGFKSIDNEIDFYNKIVTIEKYIGKKIKIPKEITQHDINKISHIVTLIQGKEWVDSWTKLTVSVSLTETLRSSIIDSKNSSLFIIFLF